MSPQHKQTNDYESNEEASESFASNSESSFVSSSPKTVTESYNRHRNPFFDSETEQSDSNDSFSYDNNTASTTNIIQRSLKQRTSSRFFSSTEADADDHDAPSSTAINFNTSSSGNVNNFNHRTANAASSNNVSNVHYPHQHSSTTMNNSFSYHCPYEQNDFNSFNNFGFSQLNHNKCPHQHSNYPKQLENQKKYTKRQKKTLDVSKNTIHLDNVLKLKDKRTTVMIKHIPNKYTIDNLLEEINPLFTNKFDVVYLPIDTINQSNLGFAFINFLTPMHLLYFYDQFIDRQWKYYSSKKRCYLVYAKMQGKEELIDYIKKRNALCNNSNGNNTSAGLNSFTNYMQFNYGNNNSEFTSLSSGRNNTYYINSFSEGNRNGDIEVPMKYYNVFVNYYSYSLCRKKNDHVFIVEKFYNF